ncbi:hypothetical protein N7456_011863 [Penicillium angulare]|uniref:Uncharacterized protein n=1 Tax=Penicillium angulare TaxID=116970 RepID=A0A9W9K143_9EURO|nr:hypothetical protein N7456_011863 [Penicillium angulare]
MDRITETLGNISLDGASNGPEEPEQLLFEPQTRDRVPETALDDIPRFLFWIATPKSGGYNDEKWVKSQAAKQNKASSTRDIFANPGKALTAKTLNLHLRWFIQEGIEYNLVSWTSSLLFAIQYIYYRRADPRDGSDVKDIKLHDIHSSRPRCLKGMKTMRNGEKCYFGEYLSQGSLKVENKCQVISVNVLFENNLLRRIQPRFAGLGEGDPLKWVTTVQSLQMADRLQAIEGILENVESAWKYPIAVYFAALVGQELWVEEGKTADDTAFLNFFQSMLSHDDEEESADFEVVANDKTPELKEVAKLVRVIDRHSIQHSILRHAIASVEDAEMKIAMLHVRYHLEDGLGLVSEENSNETIAQTRQSLVYKLKTVELFCKRLVLILSGDD